MVDDFASEGVGLDSPVSNAAAVTPGAGQLAHAIRALYIGGTGDVTVTMLGGQTVTFSGVPAGHTLAVRVSAVTAATATNIVALW